MDYRVKDHELWQASLTPWSTRWEMRIEQPIQNIVTDRLFLSVRAKLKPGDRVEVTAIKDDRVAEVGTFLITQVYETGVDYQFLGDVIEVPDKDIPAEMKKAAEKLEVKRLFGGFFGALDTQGNTIEQFKTKAEAETFVEQHSG